MMLPVLVPVLFTFYIQGVLKKLKISGAKRLMGILIFKELTALRLYKSFGVKCLKNVLNQETVYYVNTV
jgi:hypothetical protein